MNGFNGQNATISSVTPTALVASPGQIVYTGVRIQSIPSNTASSIIYFGFYPNNTAAAALTSSTGYPLSVGQEESIDVGAIKIAQGSSYGNLQYLYLLASTGTQTIAYWGV